MQFREVRSKLEAAIPDRQGTVGQASAVLHTSGETLLRCPADEWLDGVRDRFRVSTAKDVQS
jgi:hypothetical protein